MTLFDLLIVFQFWFFIFIIGLLFFPLSKFFFSSFFDRGYLLSKPLGILILSYSTFLLGTLHILPFERVSTVGLLLTIPTTLSFIVFRKNFKKYFLSDLRNKLKLIIFEELFFFLCLILWTTVRTFQPDIHGIEKFMDFAYINSILRTTFFPAKDPWFAPLPINYYYFGHVYSSVLIKLSGIASNISFNLILGTIFALIASVAFSICTTILNLFHSEETKNGGRSHIRIIGFGILSAGFITLAGNIQVIYAFFRSIGDNIIPPWQAIFSPLTFPNSYWYPSATRFIYHSIHEFPAYALVLSDLHAHLLDTPFSLLALAFLLSFFIKNITVKPKTLEKSNVILFSLILSVLYMTNAWDSAIYFGFFILTLGFIGYKTLDKKRLLYVLENTLITFVLAISFSLPFSLFFKPFVTGIGINCAPDFLISIGNIGPFLFEKGYCQTTPLWQLLILYGFFATFALLFIVVILRVKKIFYSDMFALIIIIYAAILIITPELIYLKDIYPSYFRANTMFKLAYQAFILLSFMSIYSIFRISNNLKNNLISFKNILVLITFILFTGFMLSIVFIYPVLAVNSYYNNLTSSHGLDGTKYLKNSLPSDYEAIDFLNKTIKKQEVIAEAPGDSYSDFGRISVNTGLPTIINWTAHEWLWRGTYEITLPRLNDVKTLYETHDEKIAKTIINKYNVSLIYIGGMEYQKYPSLDINKFRKIGSLIYSKDNTQIYRVN